MSFVCLWDLPTWHWRSQQHWSALDDGDESHSGGEALRSHQVHQDLKEQRTEHPEGHAEEHRVDHQTRIPFCQWAQEVAHAVVCDSKAEEILDPWPNPLGVADEAGCRSDKHVDQSKDGKQESCWVFIHPHMSGIRRQKNHGCEKAKKHDHVTDQINQEASVFEKGDVYEFVQTALALAFTLVFFSQQVRRLWVGGRVHLVARRCCRLRFGLDDLVHRSHQSTSDAAVQNDCSQDEEAPSPAKRVEQKLVERSQSEQNHRTSCHGEPVRQRPFRLEVGADDRQGWLQVEGKA